jgi:hypothetical protein
MCGGWGVCGMLWGSVFADVGGRVMVKVESRRGRGGSPLRTPVDSRADHGRGGAGM